jgi:hypothetical protein
MVDYLVSLVGIPFYSMMNNFIKRIGVMNCVMLLVVLSIIILSEYLFLSGKKLDAIFMAFWAPTILGFMNYLKYKK